jgi:uncharacterized membrane protein
MLKSAVSAIITVAIVTLVVFLVGGEMGSGLLYGLFAAVVVTVVYHYNRKREDESK